MSFHKDLHSERGSVLMETLLTIPLFIAFFSGIFVLGEMELGRSRLTAADRCALWHRACRWADADDDSARDATSGALFEEGTFSDKTKLEKFRSRQSSAGWYALFRGTAELKLELPVWAAGTRKGVIELLGGEGLDKEEWDDLSFKARETGNDPTHSVLMRLNCRDREQPPRVLSGSWYGEYRTPYLTREGGLSDVPENPGRICTAELFTRYGQFEAWSL